jgi:biopolymer transport protein ExbB
MLEKGLKMIGRPIRDVNAALENVGKLEIYKLEKGLPALATVAGGAPMIGFLGTVIGMIISFYDMSNAGNNINVSLLSNGIYTALVTTVAGLIVGIIAYFAYNILVAKVEKVVFMLEARTSEFIDLLNEPVND